MAALFVFMSELILFLSEAQMNHRKVLLTVIFVAALQIVQAQSIGLGAKGGLSLTSLTTESPLGSSSPGLWPRYHLGMFADFRFTKFSIQPEILYSRQGSKDADATGKPRVNLEYVSMPVLFKWHIPGRLNLQAGPQFSVLARAALEVESSGAVASSDLKDNLHQFDWAMCAGIGWEAPFGLLVDARYNLPITNISKGSDTVHNHVIQLSAAYRIFKFGK